MKGRMRPSALNKPIHNEKGMALLVTVLVVSLLAAMTAHFGLSARQEIIASSYAKDRNYLQAMARSGVHWGLAALEVDALENTFDSPHDRWASMSEVDFSSLFARGSLQLKLYDLGGRLQLNSLASTPDLQEVLYRLLLRGGFGLEESEQAREIIDSLLDWIDEDDEESNFGAEESYYLSRQPPYKCKNGPIAFVDELLLVKGITPEILFGNKEWKGLADFVTVLGDDGKININTADSLLLEAINENMTSELAEKMITFRDEEGNRESLSSPDWYKTKIPSWPGDIELDANIVTTASRYYLVEAKAEMHSLQRKIVATVERDEDNKAMLLTKKVE